MSKKSKIAKPTVVANPTVVPPAAKPTPVAVPPPASGDGATNPCVIRIKRHIAGPPRRAPGEILRMTPAQIAKQKLKEGDDFTYVNPISKPA